MANLGNSLYNLSLMDSLARKDTVIHRRHPLVKLLTTLLYLLTVVSFDRYEISGLMPLAVYPVLLQALGEIPGKPVLKRILMVQPLILGLGILNPWFDHGTFMLGGAVFSAGWLSFLSIVLKGGLTVAASLLLIATTGMGPLGSALRQLRVPKLFVLQLLLTYRYIAVLIEEVSRMLRAYALRAPKQKGVQFSAWGSFAGQLLLRTFDRAQRVYQAMKLRGFQGEYGDGGASRFKPSDAAYLAGWSSFFLAARYYNIPALLGNLLAGGNL